jgi:hypothetical protein
MSLFTRNTKEITVRIDEFFDTIEIGILIFKEGIKAYVKNDSDASGTIWPGSMTLKGKPTGCSEALRMI